MRANCRFAMALHVLAVLAYKDGDPVSSALLASSMNTHPVIIRRLLLALQQAKLVETRKGPGYGSRLSRSPARITLAQVYQAVCHEGLFLLPRKEANGACPVGQGIGAALQGVFGSAEAALLKDLAHTSLAALLQVVKAHASAVKRHRCRAPAPSGSGFQASKPLDWIFGG